jgi:hypothetical protein
MQEGNLLCEAYIYNFFGIKNYISQNNDILIRRNRGDFFFFFFEKISINIIKRRPSS